MNNVYIEYVFSKRLTYDLRDCMYPCIVISWACVLLLAWEYGSHGVERIQWLRQRIHFRVRAVDRSLHHAVYHPVRLRDFYRRNIVCLNDKIIVCIIFTQYTGTVEFLGSRDCFNGRVENKILIVIIAYWLIKIHTCCAVKIYKNN